MDTASQSLPVRLELLFQPAATALRGSQGPNIEIGMFAGDKIADLSGKICRADTYSMMDVIYSVRNNLILVFSLFYFDCPTLFGHRSRRTV